MKFIAWHIDKGFFWIRIFGKGFVIKNTKLHPMLFSERYKYVKYIKIKNWIIKKL